MLNELTIIIPTHNREKLINRSYYYWKDIDIKFEIFDSSKNISSSLKSYKNYNYVQGIDFYSKLYFAVSKVNTKYTLIVADDDFITLNGINQCLIFLEKNTDFVSAQGLYVDFWYNNKNQIDLSARNPFARGLYSDLTEDKLNVRLQKLMENYMHHIYAIHRTEILKESLNISKRISTSAKEINIAIVNSLMGKHKMLPILYCCRQIVELSQIVNSNTEPFNIWVKNKKNIDEINNWITILEDLYVEKNFKKHEFDKDKIKNLILNFNKKKFSLKNQFKQMIKLFIPIFLLNYFRHPLHYNKNWPPTIEEAKKIRKLTKNDKYYPWNNNTSKNEWIKIKDFLIKHGEVKGRSFKI